MAALVEFDENHRADLPPQHIPGSTSLAVFNGLKIFLYVPFYLLRPSMRLLLKTVGVYVQRPSSGQEGGFLGVSHGAALHHARSTVQASTG